MSLSCVCDSKQTVRGQFIILDTINVYIYIPLENCSALRVEVAGKYFLIVSMRACMLCVWGMLFVCCMWRHYVVCLCCMHGRFSPVLLRISSGYSE